METAITNDQAIEILSGAGHDAYGRVRLYGYIADGHESAGQMVAIKSITMLQKYPLASIVAKSNDGSVPITRA